MPTNEQEFIALVTQMRAEQKAYFAAKNGTQEKYTHLGNSRKLERQVDEALKNYNAFGQFENLQTLLF